MEAQEKQVEKELEILDASIEEIKNHPENLISWEDLKIDDKYKIKSKVKPAHEEFFDNEYQTVENIFYNKLTDLLYQLERNYIRKDGKQ
jgi:hypothetical protein